jgi:predicted nucleotidyltransferase
VDLFLEPPLDFSAAYGRALRQEVAPGTPAVFCSLEDLIALKSMAGRPEDQDDIAQLKQLRKQGKE